MTPHPERVRRNYEPCEIGDAPHVFANVVGIPTKVPTTVRSWDEQCVFCGCRAEGVPGVNLGYLDTNYIVRYFKGNR